MIDRAVVLPLMLALAATNAVPATAQPAGAANVLPRPSGNTAIGRITYHWVDSSRADAFSGDSSARRELVVDVWYPARATGESGAPYLPNLETVRRAVGDSTARRRFAPAYAQIEAGRLRSHAVEGAPARCTPRCPVLVFSHGGGVDRSFYTAQYEDYASHGYVVAAIAHTYFTHLVVFPDGRTQRLVPRPRDTMPADPAIPVWLRQVLHNERWVARRSGVAAGDIGFVLDRLTSYDRDPALGAPFLRQLDLERVGALGHSAGGMMAARACQTDSRVRACLNQDGVASNLPFRRDANGRTLAQPFLYFGRIEPVPPPLTESEQLSLQMTRAQGDSIARLRPLQQDSLLADLPGGGWRVRLTAPGAAHMSFSDEPLIQAAGDSAKSADALRALSVVQRYSRAFFDKVLLGRTNTALDQLPPGDAALVSVQRFPPARGR